MRRFPRRGSVYRQPTVKALGRQDAEFGLRQIKPAAVLWSVVPFEALHQPPGSSQNSDTHSMGAQAA
jgi:hypothetical protein